MSPQLGKSLPDDVTDDMLDDEAFLKTLHHVLLEVHVDPVSWALQRKRHARAAQTGVLVKQGTGLRLRLP